VQLRVKNRLRFAGDVLGQQAHAVALDAKVVVLKIPVTGFSKKILKKQLTL
jgi:hypothetical protein